MRALCVSRHRFLAEHIGLRFAEIGLQCTPCVGIDDAVRRAREVLPDVVIAEYELLATAPLAAWERDEVLARTPVVAVSFSHRIGERHVLDVNAIAGVLYLPTLTSEDALGALAALRRTSADAPYRWPSLGSRIDARHATAAADA